MKKVLSILIVAVGLNAGDMAQDGFTGLTWQDNKAMINNMGTYKKVYKYCKDLELGGFDDWRVPTIRELLTIVSYYKYKPAIIGGFNFAEDRFYWSSTRYKNHNGKNWGVNFRDGSSQANGIDYDRSIRCVRTTKPKKKIISKSIRG